MPAAYIEAFHRQRPGITEEVLTRALHGGCDPYRWLLEAVPPAGRVLDLACGNAPLFPALAAAGRGYLGVDASAAELAAARARGAEQLALADADRLPVPDASIAVVTASMALMVVQPLAGVLAEVHRVLAPGGTLVATVPAAGPLRPTDRLVGIGLYLALGRFPGYPNPEALTDLPALLRHAGLIVTDEGTCRFRYRLGGRADADLLLRSLYLPGIPPARLRAGARYLHALAGLGAEIGVPLRRITAIRAL